MSWGAALRGDLEMLQWARANGCPWDAIVCRVAACTGRLEVLQWLRANGCPWDAIVCRDAAAGGRPRGPAVGAGQRVRLGRRRGPRGGPERAPGGRAVGARERLPMDQLPAHARGAGPLDPEPLRRWLRQVEPALRRLRGRKRPRESD